MFQDQTELNEFALQNDAHNCLMPDRFLLNNTAEQAWSLVLGKIMLKDIADRFKKADILADYSREMRRKIPAEHLVTVMLASLESRSHLKQRGCLNPAEWADWVNKAHRRVLSNSKDAVNPEWRLNPRQLKLDTQDGIVARMMELLGPYTNISFYRSLPRQEKDLADFVVNAALCNLAIMSPDFVEAFIEEYSPLMERQSGFVMSFTRAKKNNSFNIVHVDLRRPSEEIPFSTYWHGCIDFLKSAAPNRDRDYSLRDLTESSTMLLRMCSNERPGILNAIREQISADEQALVAGINQLNVTVSDVGLEVNQESWVAALAMAANLPEWPDFPELSQQVIDVLEAFTSERATAAEEIDHCESFERAAQTISDVKRAMTAEIAKPRTNTNEIARLSTELNESTEVFEKYSNDLGLIFLRMFKLFHKVRDSIREMSAGAAPLQLVEEVAPTPVEPTYPDLSDELAKVNDELQVATNSLQVELEAKQAAQAAIEQLKEELTQTREENHQLKQRVSYLPKANEEEQAPKPSFDIHEFMTGVREPSPAELLTYFQEIAPDRVVVLPSAFNSADTASNFQQGCQLGGLLQRLIFPYLDAINSGKSDTEAKTILGKGYKAKESDTVRQNRRMRSQREYAYNDQIHYFERHIGIGRNYGTQNSIRVHFDILDGKVVIAYAGEHLESAQTN